MNSTLKKPRSNPDRPPNTPARDVLSLVLLVGGAGTLALVLWGLNGPPRLPELVTDWDRLLLFLTSSSMLSQHALDAVTLVGWLALAYLAFIVLLRVLLRVLTLGRDPAWTRLPLKLSDVITVPAVRHIVDGAIAATLVLALSLRSGGPTALEAAPAVQSEAVFEFVGGLAGLSTADPDCEPSEQQAIQGTSFDCVVQYEVRPGDSLWDIARHFYGDGTRYAVIFDQNEGRFMASGEQFINPRLIRPGWQLDIPISGSASANLWQDDGVVHYRVKSGDSLWRIAERFLGDGWRWTEIWELNQERDMGGGRRFTNPGLLVPGWMLTLPLEVHPIPSPPAAMSPPVEAPSLSPSPVPSLTHDDGARSADESVIGEDLGPAKPIEASGLPWVQAMAVAAGLATAGGAALLVRRVRRRDGEFPEEPIADTGDRPVSGDLGRVVLAAKALLSALAELEFVDLDLVLVREAERYLEFTMECTPGDAEAAVGRRFELGRRLACAVDGQVLNSTRVSFKLSRFHRLAGMLAQSEVGPARLMVVPLGAADRSIYYLNLASAENGLLAGSPRDAGRLASSWVAALASVYGPDNLAFLTDGTGAAQLGELTALPHFGARRPGQTLSAPEVVSELEEILVARNGHAANASPLLVAVLGLNDPGLERERLEVLLHRGRESQLHIIGLSADASEADVSRGFQVVVSRGVLDSTEEGDGAFPAPDQLVVHWGQEPPLVLEPVEVSTWALRALARQHGVAETSQEAHVDDQNGASSKRDPKESPSPESDEPGTLEREAESIESPTAESGTAVGVQQDQDRRESEQRPTMSVAASSRQGLLLAEPEETQEGDEKGPVFSVRCLGEFQVEAQGQVVTAWTLQKARELLAYLLARGGAAVLREEVGEALWPEGDPAQTGQLLSDAAYRLRRILKQASGDGDLQPFSASGQRYYLRSGLFRVDVDAFDAHVRRAEALTGSEALVEYERALAVYRGEFLGKDPYEWAEPYRREYQRRFADAAHKGATVALACRDVRKALEFYRAIQDCDPIDEEATRGLMKCYRELGDTNGVRKVYKALREALRRELDDEKSEPLPETNELLRELTA